jgi:hypothetical protein
MIHSRRACFLSWNGDMVVILRVVHPLPSSLFGCSSSGSFMYVLEGCGSQQDVGAGPRWEYALSSKIPIVRAACAYFNHDADGTKMGPGTAHSSESESVSHQSFREWKRYDKQQKTGLRRKLLLYCISSRWSRRKRQKARKQRVVCYVERLNISNEWDNPYRHICCSYLKLEKRQKARKQSIFVYVERMRWLSNKWDQ